MIEATKGAIAKAFALGRLAAKEDGWLAPSFDGLEQYPEFGDFQLYHRESWEQTDQFQVGWLDRIIAISEPDANRQGIFMHTSNHMTWYEGFQVPCREAFWELWSAMLRRSNIQLQREVVESAVWSDGNFSG